MSDREPAAQDRASDPPTVRSGIGWLLLLMALLPSVLAVWLVPAFTTQDGPAHLYNAHILVESFRPESAFGNTFEVKLQLIPNWLGHLLGMALVAVFPFGTADRLMTTVPLVALAAATFAVRRPSRSLLGEATAAQFASLVGMNVCWLFGFTGFLLGACLMPVTLGVWWGGRDRMSPRRTWALAGLIVLGYFAHAVSLGLTAFGIVVLALTTPGERLRERRDRTLLALSPLVILGPIYRYLMRQGGPIRPEWGHLKTPFSAESWKSQIGWADPISLGRKGSLPFIEANSPWLGLLSPAFLMAVAVAVLVLVSRKTGRERRGWGVLGAVLVIGGFVCPDTLGAAHGNYLPPRIVLMGLVGFAGWFDFGKSRAAFGVLFAAWGIQSATVVDYARESSKTAEPFLAIRSELPPGRSIGTLLIDASTRFRANPALHADCLLGLGTGRIVLANYETNYYYFPVQLHPGLAWAKAGLFEEIARRDAPADAAIRRDLWAGLLKRHECPELLVIRGDDPALDAVTWDYFQSEPAAKIAEIRLHQARPDHPESRQ